MGVVITISVIAILIILNMAACKFYCEKSKKNAQNRQKAYKEQKPQKIEQYGAERSEVQEKTAQRKSLYARIRDSVYSFLDSLLRLNLAVVAYFPSHAVRGFFYRHVFCVDMDKSSVLYYGAEIRAPWNLHIGKGTIIGDRAILDARSGIYIGDNVNFSTGVWIWTLQHNVQAPDFSSVGEGKTVRICDRAWLSCRTVVLPGVTVEEGAVVAAGAVLTKDCDPFTIWGGVPAKCIGERNKALTYEFSGNHMLFL